MISVVLPTLNAADRLAECLGPLIPGAVDGLVREVILADGGSTDDTFAIADDAGAVFLACTGDDAARTAAACVVAKGPWLLLLRPGRRLGSEWMAAAKAHIADYPRQGAAFRPALDDHRPAARLKEALAGLAGSPDDAVLIPKVLHEAGGAKARGFRLLPARVFRIAASGD